MRLKDKVAIVTGGAMGIGKGIAAAYVREGADVVIADMVLDAAKATAAELQKSGRRVVAIQTDVADETSVNKMVDKTLADFGHIDILVNNAGVDTFYPFLELSVAEWDRIIGINLRGPFLCSRRVAKHMAEKQGGVIINMTSIVQDIPTGVEVHYAASKGGLKTMTKAMAISLAPYNIRVNAIAPGAIITTLAQKLGIKESEERTARTLARIPANRMGKPEDIAGTAVFLASDESAYITGSVIFVDGGVTALGFAKAF